MASKNESGKCETLADVLNEIREYNALVPAYIWADRIEAAWKREREAILADAAKLGRGKVEVVYAADRQQGNAAAMLEALREAIGETCAGCARDCDDCVNLKSGWMKKAKAALSAPARNCDKMPDIDNLTMHDLAKSPCKSTLEYASRDELLSLVRWLLAPAAERKGDGDGM